MTNLKLYWVKLLFNIKNGLKFLNLINLGALEDFSQDVREGLHRMLASCQMSTMAGLKLCTDKLLDNLKKYPNDKRSTYRCLQRIGAKHPELVLPLVPLMLNAHPFFDLSQPDVDSPQCIL